MRTKLFIKNFYLIFIKHRVLINKEYKIISGVCILYYTFSKLCASNIKKILSLYYLNYFLNKCEFKEIADII